MRLTDRIIILVLLAAAVHEPLFHVLVLVLLRLLLPLNLLHLHCVPPPILIIALTATLAPVLMRIGIQAQNPIPLAIAMELALNFTAVHRADIMSSQPAHPTARRIMSRALMVVHL